MKYKAVLIHPHTKKEKEIPIGFSWKVAIGGFFIPLFQKMFKFVFLLWAIDLLFIVITMLLVSIYTSNSNMQFSIIIGLIIAFCINHLILPFKYNQLYIKQLIKKGFEYK